jgi:nucleotide-binding universal stress UspA family protein
MRQSDALRRRFVYGHGIVILGATISGKIEIANTRKYAVAATSRDQAAFGQPRQDLKLPAPRLDAIYRNSEVPLGYGQKKGTAMPGIVVGVDGSAGAERALDWAMREAAVHKVPLTVVAVREVTKSYWGRTPVVGPADASLLGELRHNAEELTQAAADRLGDARPATVNVHVVNGFVVKELVDAASDADLVVLGPRSGGSFARLVMGSVSSEVVQHSACPVVIIPHPK